MASAGAARERTGGSAADVWPPARLAAAIDALSRHQKELPPWLLAEQGDAEHQVRLARLARRGTASAERALVDAQLDALLALGDARTVVLVHPRASDASSLVVDALRRRAAAPPRVVVVEPHMSVARHVATALRVVNPVLAVSAVETDLALSLSLPREATGPRLLLLLGNALGAWPTVGAIRVLRTLRAAMAPADALVLGLDQRARTDLLEAEGHDPEGQLAAHHLAALQALWRGLGAPFDELAFTYRVVHEAEAHRLETHLVARRAVRLSPTTERTIELRKGESIRSAVDCRYDRARLGAMLAGVGLGLAHWWDEAEGYALAVATPVRR